MDKLTTIKYAVGMWNQSVTVRVNEHGNGLTTLKFVNRARHSTDYEVRNFSVEVISTGGIPQVEVSNLPQTLPPGYSHDATLSVSGASPGREYEIRLKLNYETTVDGVACEKIITLKIWT